MTNDKMTNKSHSRRENIVLKISTIPVKFHGQIIEYIFVMIIHYSIVKDLNLLNN